MPNSPSRLYPALALGLTAFAVAGCAAGASVEDIVPRAALETRDDPLPPPSQPMAQAGGVEATTASVTPLENEVAPANDVFTGTGRAVSGAGYPNINIQPRGATNQLRPAEANARRRQMAALSAALQDGRISSAEYQRKLAELRRLAASHSGDAIRKIEE